MEYREELERNAEKIAPHLAVWLSTGVNELFRHEGAVCVQGEVWRVYTGQGRPGSARWVSLLRQLAWVPSKRNRDQLFKPDQVCTLSFEKIFNFSHLKIA